MDGMNGSAVCVGIDLGTSRSSISASNGERHVVDSCVGWPVDMVARKLVPRPLLIGREAIDHRSMLDLRWPLERGIVRDGSERDREAVLELLRHLVALAGLDAHGERRPPVRAVVGVPVGAFRASKQLLRAALHGLADSVMLVSQPFAVAYGLDALLHAVIIDIGAGTIDVCVMQGRYPAHGDERAIPDAGDAVDAELARRIRERHPGVQLSAHLVRGWKERWSFVGLPKQRVIVDAPVRGRATAIDITDEMRAACERIVGPIAETVADLLARVPPEYHQDVRANVIVAGGGSLIPGLPEALERALADAGGGAVVVAKDPIFAASDGALAIARDATAADWERLSL